MTKDMKVFGGLCLCLAASFAMTACGGSSSGSANSGGENQAAESGAASGDSSSFEPVTLRMANQHSSDTIANQLDQEMCERIAEETDGRITIELYSDSALGDYTNVFDELMVGTIDVAHITPVETYDSRVSASMIPYLSFNYDQLLQVYAEDGYLFTQVSDALSNLGIHLSGIFCEGFNGVGSMSELTNPTTPGADKGIICRSPMTNVYSLCLQDMGFRVSSIAYSDTYTAMQTGVVGGLAGGTAQVNYLTFRDLIKAFYDYRYIQEATLIMFNQDLWNSFLPEDQETIAAIVRETCEKAAQMAEESNNDYMSKLQEEGIEVVTFTDDELNAFAESCRANVWPQLEENYPEGFLEGIEESLQ